MLINLPSLNMETHLLVLVFLLVMIQLSVGDLVVMVIQQLFARIVFKTEKSREYCHSDAKCSGEFKVFATGDWFSGI